MKQCSEDREGIYYSVLSELKSLGVKVPKFKKFKAAIPKQEKSNHVPCGKVFGVCLCDQEKVLTDDFLLPKFIVTSTSYLKNYCHKEIGLFRKAGSISRQRDLRAKLEKGESIENSEPNDVASLLKQWLRELPEPLIPVYLHDLFIRCQSLEEKETKVAALLLCCHLLPTDHLHTLKHLMEFLSVIASNSDKNKMGVHNLALIMAPNIFVIGKESFDKSSGNLLQLHTSILELLIIHVHKIGEIPLCPSFLLSESYGNNLDISTDLLDLSPSKSKKKRKSGTVQDLFSGIRKLVSQNSTPPNSFSRLQDDPKSSKSVSRFASKRKADPDVLSMSPAKKQNCGNIRFSFDILNATPSSKSAQNVFGILKEKTGSTHSRRKSFGLLKRKKEKGPKSDKYVEEEKKVCTDTSSPFSTKLSVSFEDCLEPKKIITETSPPLLSTLDIERILSRSYFAKKSVSDGHLLMYDKEFKDLPVLSASSESCLNDVKHKSRYNLRCKNEDKSPLKRKCEVLDRNFHTPSKNKENSFPGILPTEKIQKLNTSSMLEIPKRKVLSPKYVNIKIGIENSCSINKSLSSTSGASPRPGITRMSKRRGNSLKRKNLKLSVDSNAMTADVLKGVSTFETHAPNSVNDDNNTNFALNDSKLFNPAVINVKRASNVERRASVTRQDAFIIKPQNKKKVSQVKSDDSAMLSTEKSQNITKQQTGNTLSDMKKHDQAKELTVCSRESTSAFKTPEGKKLRRNIRNGSIVRGRPNTIKSGLPSDLGNRFLNDSVFVNVKKINSSISSVDDDLFINQPNNLDVSKTAHIDNMVLSTPPNCTSICKAEEAVLLVNETIKVKKSDSIKDASTFTKPESRTKVCSNSDSKVQKPRRKLSKVSRTHSFPNPHVTRSAKSRKQLRTLNSSSARKCTSASNEPEKENICLDSSTVDILNNEALNDPYNKPATPEDVVWVSGEKFFASEVSPQNDVFNVRESIAMILKNNPGHVLAKVSLYDNSKGSAPHTPVAVSYSTPCELLRGSHHKSIQRRLSQRANTSSLKRNKSTGVKTSDSVQRHKNRQLDLPPPPEFFIPDSNPPSPKTSFPLKELTNISNGGDISLNLSPIRSSFTTPVKDTMSPCNFVQNTPNQKLVLTTTTYSGHTPYKIPRVFRSESSPLLVQTSDRLTRRMSLSRSQSTIADRREQKFSVKENCFNSPTFKTKSALSIEKLKADQLVDEWQCEM